MELDVTMVAKSPGCCTADEISSFVSLVIDGGEIDPAGLDRRVRRAKSLVFARDQTRLLGVAALKIPSQGYRDRVARSSGAAIPRAEFPYELGWVFVSLDGRSRGLSYRLSTEALKHAGTAGVFATSHNDRMQSTLSKLGFVPAGNTYPSRLGDRVLRLFLLNPAG